MQSHSYHVSGSLRFLFSIVYCTVVKVLPLNRNIFHITKASDREQETSINPLKYVIVKG